MGDNGLLIVNDYTEIEQIPELDQEGVLQNSEDPKKTWAIKESGDYIMNILVLSSFSMPWVMLNPLMVKNISKKKLGWRIL
jgi:hypothetical protein